MAKTKVGQMQVLAMLLGALMVTAWSCGDETGNTGATDTTSGADVADTEPSAGVLQCARYSWCTTYGALDEAVTNAPELNGGPIADGVYRLEQGHFGQAALVFQGSRFVHLDGSYLNKAGAWSANGGTLSLIYDTDCDSEGEEAFTAEREWTFASQGSTLFVRNGDGDLLRYERVSSLCTESDDFNCRVANCVCTEAIGEPLPEDNCY